MTIAARLTGLSEGKAGTAVQEQAVDQLADEAAVLLAGGDKSTNWKGWYDQNIPLAEERYADWQTARKEGT